MSLNNVNKVLLFLTNNQNSTITEISEKNQLSRETTKRIIDSLKDDDIVIKQKDTYSLSNIFCQITNNKNNNTYFGVDILESHKHTINYLFYKIKSIWYNATGKLPTKTQIYKIIVQINLNLNLGLPIVRYKYGQITPVIFQNNIDYLKEISLVDSNLFNYDKEIKDTIIQNISFNSKEIERLQHEKNPLYSLKDKLLDNIYLNNIDFVIDNLDDFLDLMSYDADLSRYKDDFYSFVYNFYKLSKENRTKTDVKDIFIQIFNTMWDIVAVTNFREDIKQYYITNNKSIENINLYFSLELSVLKDKFIELLDTFDDMFAITDFFNDTETQELINKSI
ncbi:MAG: helix-turn-helix domain-containing protein [Candidatus ainarchaeum sp.]|nr:helix-turn-helix domain-containing protein [Candidatus ainarchaeum sp.]